MLIYIYVLCRSIGPCVLCVKSNQSVSKSHDMCRTYGKFDALLHKMGGGGGGVSNIGSFHKIAGSGTLCQLWSFIEQVVPSNNLLEERGLSQTFLLNSAKQRCIQNPAQHLRRRTSECKPAKVLNLPYYMESTRIFQTVFFFYDFFFSDTQNEVWCCEEF